MQALETINEQFFFGSTTKTNLSSDYRDKGKTFLIEEINQAVLELSLIKAGKKEARDAEDFICEL